MQKAKAGAMQLPAKMKVEYIKGPAFISLKRAAKLAGINSISLEIGQKLLTTVDGEGAILLLATPELIQRANDIEAIVRLDLRKIAKAIGPGGLSVKSVRDADKLAFWYTLGPGPRRKAV